MSLETTKSPTELSGTADHFDTNYDANDTGDIANAEEKRAREVEELLKKTGISRDEIEQGSEASFDLSTAKTWNDVPEEHQPASVWLYDTPSDYLDQTGDHKPETASPEPHPFEILGSLDEKPADTTFEAADPSLKTASKIVGEQEEFIRTVHEKHLEANEKATKAAHVVKDELVPELGMMMNREGDLAILASFPPSVQDLVVKTKLKPDQTMELLGQFSKLFTLSAQMRSRVETIEVNSEEDVAAIAEAKECHSILRNERLNAEKKKKIIKEPFLRPAQVIDGVFRIWMDEIGPLESLAKEKAEYAANLVKARIQKLAEERFDKLKLFGTPQFGLDQLGKMEPDAFETVYQGAIAQYNTRIAEEKRAEEEKQKQLREAQAEAERLRIENDRLAKEAADRAAVEAENNRLLAEERRKTEAAEAELRRQEAERQLEIARLAKIEEARRLAPDREKLENYAADIEKLIANVRPEINEPRLAGTLAEFDRSITSAITRLRVDLDALKQAAAVEEEAV